GTPPRGARRHPPRIMSRDRHIRWPRGPRSLHEDGQVEAPRPAHARPPPRYRKATPRPTRGRAIPYAQASGANRQQASAGWQPPSTGLLRAVDVLILFSLPKESMAIKIGHGMGLSLRSRRPKPI